MAAPVAKEENGQSKDKIFRDCTFDVTAPAWEEVLRSMLICRFRCIKLRELNRLHVWNCRMDPSFWMTFAHSNANSSLTFIFASCCD